VSIYVGRNWDTLKQSVNADFANAVDRLSRAYIVPFIVVMFALGGSAILPILLWPPKNSASSVVAVPSAEEIASAVAKKMASQPAPVAPVATGDTWDRLNNVQQADLERALKGLPKRDQFQVICLNNDCKDLSLNFMRAFRAAGWEPVMGSGAMYYQQPYGAVLYQKDVNDESLAKAIEAATGLKIEHISQSTQLQDSLFIGIRP
jgi:hypothetical protein